MLVDTGSDITLLKVTSMQDDVDIYSGYEHKLRLNGISGNITTIGEAYCHIQINNRVIKHTVHVVPAEFQLNADGLIGMDLLQKLGATIYCNQEVIEVSQVNSENTIPTTLVNCNNDTSNNEEINLNIAHLNQEEREMLTALCNKYKDIFRKPGQRLSCTRTVQHEIPVSAEQAPINQRPYRLPETQKATVKQHIDEMRANGIIRESCSAWNSPIIIVPKKGKDKTRFCTDYRKLNEVTKGDAHPLPNITEILDQLGGMRYFSTLDLSAGFHQIEIKESDKEKTAFSTPQGHFEYERMPFGLKGAPATFQRLMNEVLRGLIGSICFVYIDDIVCYGRDLTESIDNLEKVFVRLREHKLLLNVEKCSLLHTSVTYLGHIVSRDGVSPDPSKIAAVKNYPEPKNVKELKSFLGLAGYYRRFIKDFAKIAKPLNALFKEGVEYCWSAAQEEAFSTLKNMLTSQPILQYPDFSKEFLLTTDASTEALGAVLSQGELGKDKPIAYASRTLNNAERNYSTTQQELLAIVWAVKQFRPYLWGRHFKVITDHRPLKWLISLKDPDSRLTRWTIKLSEYDFEVIHRPGKNNQNADALSRVTLAKVDITPQEILDNQRKQDDLKEIERTLDKYEKDSQGYLYYRDKRNRRRLIVPKENQKKVLEAYHDTPFGGHQGIERTSDLIKERYYWQSMDKDIAEYVQTCHKCNERKTTAQDAAPAPMKISSPLTKPFQKVALDIVGPLPKTHAGNQYILTFQDHFSKYPEAFALPDQKTTTVAKVFVEEIVCRHGTPEKLLTDQGSNFTSELFKEMCKLLNIDKLQTTAYHPASNGIVERSHQTIMSTLSQFVDSDQRNWDVWLPYVMLAYRATPHSTTRYSPYYLLHGREMRLPTDWVREEIQIDLSEDDLVQEVKQRIQIASQKVIDNTQQRKESSKQLYDLKAREKQVSVGDKVLLHQPFVRRGRSKKLCKPWIGPYTVIKVDNDVNVTIKKGKITQKVHVNRIKLFRERN